jgi:hypothetical protein
MKMGGTKNKKKKKNKEGSVNWKSIEKTLQEYALQSGVKAYCLSRDTTVQLNKDYIWVAAEALAYEHGSDTIFFEFLKQDGDLGDTLIRTQQALCTLTHSRKISSDKVTKFATCLNKNPEIFQACVRIERCEHNFINAVIQNKRKTVQNSSDSRFIAYCANNYYMCKVANIKNMFQRIIKNRADPEYNSAVRECSICLEEKKCYSTLWKCDHTICYNCCFAIIDSKYDRCPLCRSINIFKKHDLSLPCSESDLTKDCMLDFMNEERCLINLLNTFL